MALRLFLQGALTADQVDNETIAYEFISQVGVAGIKGPLCNYLAPLKLVGVETLHHWGIKFLEGWPYLGLIFTRRVHLGLGKVAFIVKSGVAFMRGKDT